jgi:hypothetical protein
MRIIGNAGKARELQAVASGALSTGDTVVVNSDGTVGLINQTGGTVGQAVGDPVVFEADRTLYPSVTFDSNSNKIVVSFRDQNNSSYGTAVVGTVSGTSITFGTPVVFASAQTNHIASTFDSNENKVVICYQDGGNSARGTAIAGNVSGDSISFGSEVQFESGATQFISATFDSVNNKVVVAYEDDTNADKGTARVLTVSGTTISPGSTVIFEAGSTQYISTAFDSNAGKVVIAFRDVGNSNYGKAIVGTVSGTGISFGSAVTFESASTAWTSIAFDSNSNKVVIAYMDDANIDKGTAIVGTVSGTTISFGSPVIYSGSTEGNNNSISFDSNANKLVIAYQDNINGTGKFVVGTVSGTSISFGTPVDITGGQTNNSGTQLSTAFDSSANKVVCVYGDFDNSEHGTATVFQNAGPGPNSANFIGFAATGAPDGKAAKINIKGAVDENQSGLTAGQSYYVQTDGTLGTTPADPSVFAGTAVAATKLIVKG